MDCKGLSSAYSFIKRKRCYQLVVLIVICVTSIRQLQHVPSSLILESLHGDGSRVALSTEKEYIFVDTYRTRHHQSQSRVVIFSCNQRYAEAVASSVISVRKEGGYTGDIAIILEETLKSEINYTVSSIRDRIFQLGLAANVSHDLLTRLEVFTTDELFDSLLDSSSPTDEALRETPTAPVCLKHRRNRLWGFRSYYLKMLMFHPKIAKRWDLALYMDACMTFHSPHVHELFELPQISGHILALQDPWIWAQQMLENSRAKCRYENVTLLDELRKEVGKPLANASYFTSGLLLYDTRILAPYYEFNENVPVRHNPTTLETPDDCTNGPKYTENITGSYHQSLKKVPLLELFRLYQKFAPLFEGDQQIVSVYWSYQRQLMWHIPMVIPGTNRVPYEFFDVSGPRMLHDPHIITAGSKGRPVCRLRPS